MSTRKRLALCAAMFATVPALAQAPQFGQEIAPADIAPWDISIGPDGAGLPPGRGTASQGEAVYAAKCQPCHSEKGAGGPNDALVGGIGSLAPGKSPVKTVGSYWPYATTLFDYIRRAMPFPETKSLTNDEVYAVSAYILNLNGVVGTDEVLDAQSLPKVKMPNRDGSFRSHAIPSSSFDGPEMTTTDASSAANSTRCSSPMCSASTTCTADRLTRRLRMWCRCQSTIHYC